MKGARQARIVADTIVGSQGVPESFARAFRALDSWIRNGRATGTEIPMTTDG
jgi:hypothetical protein